GGRQISASPKCVSCSSFDDEGGALRQGDVGTRRGVSTLGRGVSTLGRGEAHHPAWDHRGTRRGSGVDFDEVERGRERKGGKGQERGRRVKGKGRGEGEEGGRGSDGTSGKEKHTLERILPLEHPSLPLVVFDRLGFGPRRAQRPLACT
ncbi:hypothetical protein K523DRAFT_422450, partial [Schizophyllum commune Tattone D]